jgi:hypothetical protein
MTPGVRKAALTAHVATSVGWMGAVAGFLALSIAGLASPDVQVARGAYLSMEVVGRYVIVPLSLAALITGLVQSLGTEWGLFRHYWIVAKLVLSLLASAGLLLHQFTAVAGAARRVSASAADELPSLGTLPVQLAATAGAGLVVLLITAGLSVFKPWGRTRFGLEGGSEISPGLPRGFKVSLIIVGLLLVTFIIIHLAGRGLGHHLH